MCELSLKKGVRNMRYVTHNNAVMLEALVRCAFKHCNRFDLSGLATSSHFQSKPLDAAIMIISAIYAKGKSSNHDEFCKFLFESECTFEVDVPEETRVNKYINVLCAIVSKYF